MALLADIDDSYTKTGKGFLTRWANRASMIPFIGGAVAYPLGMIDTVIETAQWLFRGQFGSAFTALTAGTVSNTVNALTTSFGLDKATGIATKGITWWFGNAASGALTGSTIGTHARAATEALIGAVSRPLGMEPQVLKSYQAGIGSISANQMQSGPGKFASQVSAQRGENADQAYSRYISGEGGVHVNELQSAHGRSA